MVCGKAVYIERLHNHCISIESGIGVGGVVLFFVPTYLKTIYLTYTMQSTCSENSIDLIILRMKIINGRHFVIRQEIKWN